MLRNELICMKATGITIVKYIRAIWLICLVIAGCTVPNNRKFTGKNGEIKLIILNPGDFHASLVQKNIHPQIDSTVYVYAPQGNDLDLHLFRIESFNKRKINPTNWNTIVYKGADFKEKMLEEQPGNLVIIAGNNNSKIHYIQECINAGLNVLTSNPMIISKQQFHQLRESFRVAREKDVLLYDAMAKRQEITNMLQRDLSQISELFGHLENGTPENPAIIQENTNYFYKTISGLPVVRPPWFFDINQEGEGLANTGSHLVDLVQWQCFPQQIINYEREIAIIRATHWATPVSLTQFKQVTLSDTIPSYLKEFMRDTTFHILSNGEMLYRIKDVYAKVKVQWNFDNNEDHDDIHYAVMRGTRANLIVRQGPNEDYKPTLYIEPVSKTNGQSFEKAIQLATSKMQAKYKNLAIVKRGKLWEVKIPDVYKAGYETHFEQVVEKYLHSLKEGSLPEWEVPNILAKYYTITQALEMAAKK
ncbi:MAG TPA: putative oxidoreductase C-terminal domain-containing protein [Bacteroidales bacterium]|nr:putative oxidoreductase C-terminal domain-containing protein [Bacteroidales bacterium]